MMNCYLNTFSRPQMRAAAGFDPDWAGSYFISRAINEPPDDLRSQIFPKLDYWRDIHISPHTAKRGAQANKAAYYVIQLLVWLRDVLLQDAPFLQLEFPDHPIWLHPVFSQPSYLRWAQNTRDSAKVADTNSYLATIEKAYPAIASKLGSVTIGQASHTSKLDLLTSKIAGIEAQLEDMAAGQQRIEQRLLHPDPRPWVLFPPAAAPLLQPLAGVPVVPATAGSAFPFPDPPPAAAAADPLIPPIPPIPPVPVAAVAAADQPPLWPVPRNTKTVRDLMKIWQLGSGEMPPMKALEERWGSRWRPVPDRQHFSRLLFIIREVYKLADNTGQLVEDVAKKLDRERGHATLNKVFELLKSRQRRGNSRD
jgi:hypothetical protein